MVTRGIVNETLVSQLASAVYGIALNNKRGTELTSELNSLMRSCSRTSNYLHVDIGPGAFLVALNLSSVNGRLNSRPVNDE